MVESHHVSPLADVAMPPLRRARFHRQPARTDGGSTARRYSSVWISNNSQLGIDMSRV